MLYIVATPIGNLADISIRALKTLEACDYLLCEDTRITRRLLNHYDIKKPLKSYHRFNEAARESGLIADLHAGQTVGLVSDAGTPTISDPGERIVARCRAEGIAVTPIPGPSAAITALSASGLPTSRFQFCGFLPKKKGKCTKALQEYLAYPGTTILYESPYRLLATLKILAEIAPNTTIVIARELTKKFEEIVSGTPPILLAKWESKTVKGELVLLLSKKTA